MTITESPSDPPLPFPIFQVSGKVERYLLYDINTITSLRQAHNILGVLIGTLSQSPQQNVFLGLPLELQPEEARLLVDKSLAFVVNDLDWHKRDLASKDADQLNSTRTEMYRNGMHIARVIRKSKQTRTREALESTRGSESATSEKGQSGSPNPETGNSSPEETLFGEVADRQRALAPSPPPSQPDDNSLVPWTVTETASHPPLTLPANTAPPIIPNVNVASYSLFRHLHDLGYFMSPGIRFGCQFSVYPGDPLRYHSHFLSMSYDWDEEFELLELIAGGRLGTGVKKGWLIGGLEEPGKSDESEGIESNVRTFCIEWGGM